MIIVQLTDKEASAVRGAIGKCRIEATDDWLSEWSECLTSATEKIIAAEAAAASTVGVDDEIEIETGIPIPRREGGAGRPPGGSTYQLRRLPLTCSMFLPGVNAKPLRTKLDTAISYLKKRYGLKYVVRTAEKDGVEGVRVWRVE